MDTVELILPSGLQHEIWSYLNSDPDGNERALFALAVPTETDSSLTLTLTESMRMEGALLEWTSPHHIALSDEARRTVIKWAHDEHAALIEFHSHTSGYPAKFSPSDFSGFEEWVPHVLWRLPGRPYTAVVVTKRNFDALCWRRRDAAVEPITKITADGSTLEPTNLSVGKRHAY